MLDPTIFCILRNQGLEMKKNATQEQGIINLVPMGLEEERVLEVLREDLEKAFAFRVRTLSHLEIPAEAYSSRRNQYQAPLFLAALRRRFHPERNQKFLGITDKDLYVEGLNFVFGQAQLRGPFAVISLARLHQAFYGLPEDRALFLKRALKEAVHELGHSFGLDHCPHSECVMHFSNSLQDTDHKSFHFCSSCQARLEPGSGL